MQCPIQFMEKALMEKRRLLLNLAVRITLQIAVFDRDYFYVSVTFLCVAQHKGGRQHGMRPLN